MMWNLSEPHVFACNLNHLLDQTPGARFVFVASNSGTEADVALLREHIRAPCVHKNSHERISGGSMHFRVC